MAMALAVVAFRPSVALAQDEGPIVIGEQEKWEWFKLQPFDVSFEFLGRMERDQTKQRDLPRLKDSDDIFTQRLILDGGGFIGHPNFVDLNLDGTFGISEEWIDAESVDRHEREINSLLQYNVSALILRQSKLPTTLYSQRSQNFVNRQFGDSLDVTSTETGARLLVRSATAPTTVHYFHSDEVQTDDLHLSDFNLVQDTFEWQTQWRINPNQQLTWDYFYSNVQQSGTLRPNHNYDQHNGVANHTWDFGSENQNNLRSTLLLFREGGDNEFDHIHLDEAMRLHHTPTFETRYNYAFDWQNRPDSTQVFNRGDIGFQHHLFDSLITTAYVGGSNLDVTPGDFNSDQIFGVLDSRYFKMVPLGRLTSGLLLAFTIQDDSGVGTEIEVDNQPEVFGSAGLIILNRRNIDPTSIRITNASGTIEYVQGVDYTVRTFGDQIEIRRILGGDISNNQVVLVDYIVLPEPPNTTTTLGIGTNWRYDFDQSVLKGIGLYFRYLHQTQDRTSDALNLLVEANVDDIVYGIDYHLWSLTLSAEQQYHDSTVSPYDATRFMANVVQPLGRGSSLVLNASYDDIDRTQEDVQTIIASISGQWNQQLSNTLSMALIAIWRNENDSDAGNVQGWEQEFNLTWRYRQTSVYGSFRNAILDSDVSDTQVMTFVFGFKRDF